MCVLAGKLGLKFIMLERFLQFKKFENYSWERDPFDEAVLYLPGLTLFYQEPFEAEGSLGFCPKIISSQRTLQSHF